MSLKLMYITNRPGVARIATDTGVDRIFVDLEYIGKKDRQSGKDTVMSDHSFDDVMTIRRALRESTLVVRCNPIHDETESYSSSRDEIEKIISCGADIIMLPYFKTVGEVEDFLRIVNGRTKTLLLVETPEAVEQIDHILDLRGIDEVFIGLNDLSLGYNQVFMFQPLVDGTVERLCDKFQQKQLPYGFGGIASLGKGLIPSQFIIKEHYRLGSTCSILSRSFCNATAIKDIDLIWHIFTKGVKEIRDFEEECVLHPETWGENHRLVAQMVEQIVKNGGPQ